MKSGRYMMLNGEYFAEEKVSVSPLNRAMMYGDGCFETIRFYSGKFLGWQKHFNRLSNGLSYLGMEPGFSSPDLKEFVVQLSDKNQLSNKDAMVRIQCWRKGERGYKPSSTKANWMVQIGEISPKKAPLRLTVANTRCIPDKALSRQYKLSNGLNYIKAAQEAKAKNKDDALMLTISDKISETTSANIFWINNESVFTPSKNCDLLPGITRSMVIEVCRKQDIPVHEGTYDLYDIQEVEAAFCTNSLIEILEISEIEDKELQLEHPTVRKIKEGFESYKMENLKI